MKTISKLFALVLLMFSGATLNAQQYKFGHIESQSIIIEMPEYAAAGDSLNKMRMKYSETAESIQVEINRKYNDLLEKQNTLDSLILESMFTELQGMQENLENFNNQANQKLRNLEAALLEDVVEKLQTAIDAVGKEMDLLYIFDVSGRNPVYVSDKSVDVGSNVKEKLGIQ